MTTRPQRKITDILSEYCWHHGSDNGNGGWTCRQCHIEQGTLDVLELANARIQARQDRKVREDIAHLDFVEAMKALGYIEDGSVIDAFWNGLLTETEVAQIEQGQQVWQEFSTEKIRAVLESEAA